MTRPFRYQPLTGADTAVCRYAISARASTPDTSQVTSDETRLRGGGVPVTPSSDDFGADNENSKLADRIRPPLSPTQTAEVWRRSRTNVCWRIQRLELQEAVTCRRTRSTRVMGRWPRSSSSYWGMGYPSDKPLRISGLGSRR